MLPTEVEAVFDDLALVYINSHCRYKTFSAWIGITGRTLSEPTDRKWKTAAIMLPFEY